MLFNLKEKESWTYWLYQETYDPKLLLAELVDEWIATLSTPYGLCILDTYKAAVENTRINRVLATQPAKRLRMTIGASHFFGGLVRQSIEPVGI